MTKRLLASLALAAYVVTGSGVANQLVYCIGADGHHGIEQMHTAAPCEASGHRSFSALSAAASDSCTDLPLLLRASKENEKLNDRSPRPGTSPTALVAPEPKAEPRTCAATVLAFTAQDVASLRTIVLRV